MRDERGSSILEYLIAGLIFFVVIFTIPLLIHGVQDYEALANAERVAMHQEEVAGYFSSCASQRLQEALQEANIPLTRSGMVSATSQQQQYGQPVSLEVRYVYQPLSWMSIPLTVANQGISQYTPGETAGGGCPPPSNGAVATGPGSPATVTIYASPNPANVGQQVTFSGEVMDQYGNPVGANVTVSGGGQSATVYAQGGYYSAVLTFGSPGTFTVWAAAGGASASTQETVIVPVQTLLDTAVNYQGFTEVSPTPYPTFPVDWAQQAVVIHLTIDSFSPQGSYADSGFFVVDAGTGDGTFIDYSFDYTETYQSPIPDIVTFVLMPVYSPTTQYGVTYPYQIMPYTIPYYISAANAVAQIKAGGLQQYDDYNPISSYTTSSWFAQFGSSYPVYYSGTIKVDSVPLG